MTKSEFIQAVAEKFPQLTHNDVEASVRVIFDGISNQLIRGDRVEIRGFGVFSLNFRPPRRGRNSMAMLKWKNP